MWTFPFSFAHWYLGGGCPRHPLLSDIRTERAADAGCQVSARAEFQTLRKLSIPKIRSAKIASESAALPGGPFLCKGSVKSWVFRSCSLGDGTKTHLPRASFGSCNPGHSLAGLLGSPQESMSSAVLRVQPASPCSKPRGPVSNGVTGVTFYASLYL